MYKTHWLKKICGVGIACVITIGSNIGITGISASTISHETEMAGITAAIENGYLKGTIQQEAPFVLTESEKSDESNVKTEEDNDSKTSDTNTKKKEKVSKRWQQTGISIAKDYVNIRRKAGTSSKAVGKLYRGSAATILSEKGGWVKVKSGDVKGYIKKSYLATGLKAKNLSDKYGTKYAVVKSGTETLNVRKKKSTEASILTQISEDERYVVKNVGEKWAKVKIDNDTTGYVSTDYVDVIVRFKKAVSNAQERAAKLAKAKKSEEKSAAAVSTNESLGNRIVSYAKQFIGNEYEWGGTSLTHGTDCSGFTMSVYAKFGYSIPRTSATQATFGKKVSLDSLQAGDLIFYKHGSAVGHVAMYIGNGMVVHAAGEKWGIITSNMNYNTVYCARRII